MGGLYGLGRARKLKRYNPDVQPQHLLDYGRPKKSSVGKYVRRGLAILLILAVAFAAWLTLRATLNVWKRYRFMKDYNQGYAALKTYAIPAGQKIVDPAAGPMTYMKPIQTSGFHGTVATTTIPADPTLVRHLRLMGMSGPIDPLDPFAYASDRQTFRGRKLVTCRLEHLNMTDSLHVYVRTMEWTFGGFPLYSASFNFDFEVDVHLRPSDKRTLPVVLAGQSDPGNSASWTLPLILDGRPEWIRFDHSFNPIQVTSSFGRLVDVGSGYDLEY